MKAGSFPVLAPGGGHFPPQMLPVLEHQVPLNIMFGPLLNVFDHFDDVDSSPMEI